MALVVDPGLLDYMASHSGSCTFVVKDATPDDAVRGLRSARQAVAAIADREEAPGASRSSASAVERTADGATLTIDLAGGEANERLLERVLGAVIDGLAAAGLESGLVTFPADDVLRPATGTGWSAVGLPLPDPHRELWASSSRSERSAGYVLPHDTEFLLEYFELLPGLLLSYTGAPPDDLPFGAVCLVTGGRSFFVLIRDAGTARRVEMTVETDNRKVEATVLHLRSASLPPGVRVRLDRR